MTSNASGVGRARLGFVGLGQMGAPMARNLLKAGFPLTVHNRSRGIVDQLVTEGAEAAASPREVAERVDILFTCLPMPADVELVYLGSNGAIEGARAGQLFCDTSTIDRETHLKIAERLRERGVGYLDAPVSGGTTGAQDGTLSIMVGGAAEDFERARPAFEAMGKSLYLVGPVGSGAVVKLVNQMMASIAGIAAAEGLVLGTKAGIDPKLLYDIIRVSSGGSKALDMWAGAALSRNFAPGFAIDLAYKDVSLAVDLGRSLGVRLLAAGLAQQLVQEARGSGLGKLASPAAITVHERLAGVEVRAKE